MKSFIPLLMFLAVAMFVSFYIYTLISVHQSCDGAVVKNVFDWPVCVH